MLKCIDYIEANKYRGVYINENELLGDSVSNKMIRISNKMIRIEEPVCRIFDSDWEKLFYLPVSHIYMLKICGISIDNFDYENSSIINKYTDLNNGYMRDLQHELSVVSSNKDFLYSVKFKLTDSVETEETYYTITDTKMERLHDTLIVFVENEITIFSDRKFILTGVDNFLYCSFAKNYNLFCSVENYYNEEKKEWNRYNLDLSEVDMSYLSSADKMFKDTSIVNVKLNDTLNNVKSVAAMFSGCIYLESVDFNGFDFRNVKYMQHMFYNTNFNTISFDNWDTRNVQSMYKMFTNSGVVDIDLSSLNLQNLSDIDSMFAYCKNLKSFRYTGESLKKLYGMNMIFSGCIGLKEVDISGFTEVQDLSEAFGGCVSLEEVDLSNINLNIKINLVNIFNECKSLKNVVSLNDVVNVSKPHMNSAFRSCSSLDLDLDLINIRGLTCAFEGVSGRNIYIKLDNTIGRIDLFSAFINSDFDNVYIDIETGSIDFRSCFKEAHINNVFIRMQAPSLVNVEKMFYDCYIKNLTISLDTRLFTLRKLFKNTTIENLNYFENKNSNIHFESFCSSGNSIKHFTTNNKILAKNVESRGIKTSVLKVCETFADRNFRYITDYSTGEVQKISLS